MRIRKWCKGIRTVLQLIRVHIDARSIPGKCKQNQQKKQEVLGRKRTK